MAVVLAFAGRVQPCNERQLPAVRDDAQCGACTGESRTGPQDVEKPLPIEPLDSGPHRSFRSTPTRDGEAEKWPALAKPSRSRWKYTRPP